VFFGGVFFLFKSNHFDDVIFCCCCVTPRKVITVQKPLKLCSFACFLCTVVEIWLYDTETKIFFFAE
jgi:hypothetical protein